MIKPSDMDIILAKISYDDKYKTYGFKKIYDDNVKTFFNMESQLWGFGNKIILVKINGDKNNVGFFVGINLPTNREINDEEEKICRTIGWLYNNPNNRKYEAWMVITIPKNSDTLTIYSIKTPSKARSYKLTELGISKPNLTDNNSIIEFLTKLLGRKIYQHLDI